MAKDYVHIEGLDALMAKITSLEQLKALKPVLQAAGVHLQGKLVAYPPASIANSPSNPSGRWYERGYGTKWKTKDGIHGRRSSETLNRKWTVRTSNAGLTVTVGNNVSYGVYVQDPDEQASFHGARGWKTTEDVAEAENDVILGYISKEIDKVIGK